MGVLKHIDLKVHFQKPIECITSADDCTLGSNGPFLISLDSNCVVILVKNGEVISFCTILVNHGSVSLCESFSSRFCDLVITGLLTTQVKVGIEVSGPVSTWSRGLDSAKEWETTCVSRAVRNKVVSKFKFIDTLIYLIKEVRTSFLSGIRILLFIPWISHNLIDFGRVIVLGPETVVFDVEVILEGKHIESIITS